MGHKFVCVSIRAVLCFIIIESLIHVETSQVSCSNPLKFQELRVYNSKLCVDIYGTNGAGKVLAWDCDGGRDQQLILCEDGTIRNQQNQEFCLQPTEEVHLSNVISGPCSPSGGIPARQRWKLKGHKPFTDNDGILRVATMIINEESGNCLDVEGSSGKGDILSWQCDEGNDQYFFFRGRELKYGRLENEKSKLCLDVDGVDGRGNVGMFKCEDRPDQYFRFLENGEIVNEQSGLCLDVDGKSGSGNVLMYHCEDFPDQMWDVPNIYCKLDYCTFRNKRSGKCLDVYGHQGIGNVGTWTCDGRSDQRFKWV